MDEFTDAERERLAVLKLSAREREPLPDVEAMEAAALAACATLGAYLSARSDSKLAELLRVLGYDVRKIVVTLLVAAHDGEGV